MRILLATAVALLLATSHGSADEKETAMEKEMAQLQGHWGSYYDTFEFSHANGNHYEARPWPLVKTHRIRGNKWLIVGEDGKATGVEKTITLDVTTEPKQIRLTMTRKRGPGQPDEQVTEYGIYRWEKETLVIHFGLPDEKGGTKPAPKQFLRWDKLIEGVEGSAFKYERIKE